MSTRYWHFIGLQVHVIIQYRIVTVQHRVIMLMFALPWLHVAWYDYTLLPCQATIHACTMYVYYNVTMEICWLQDSAHSTPLCLSTTHQRPKQPLTTRCQSLSDNIVVSESILYNTIHVQTESQYTHTMRNMSWWFKTNSLPALIPGFHTHTHTLKYMHIATEYNKQRIKKCFPRFTKCLHSLRFSSNGNLGSSQNSVSFALAHVMLLTMLIQGGYGDVRLIREDFVAQRYPGLALTVLYGKDQHVCLFGPREYLWKGLWCAGVVGDWGRVRESSLLIVSHVSVGTLLSCNWED